MDRDHRRLPDRGVGRHIGANRRAGAFIVIVYGIVERHGIGGLLATDSAFRQRLDALEGVSALRATSRLPAPVVALVTLSLLAWALQWPVDTIGSRFGSIPQGLPALVWPDVSWQTVRQLVTPTLTIALLGAIESLLCARVADLLHGGRKHDPNQELMAQGIANAVVPFIGGMPATGTIARTVTNIRSGATSGVAGMVHAATLAAIVLLAAPWRAMCRWPCWRASCCSWRGTWASGASLRASNTSATTTA